jgi:drug/metabolite transporter (DMT)-like permease
MTASTVFTPAPIADPPSTDGMLGDVKPSYIQQAIRLLQPIAQRSIGSIALAIALIAIASASIFIVIAEQELTPCATTFDRLLIAAIAFLTWSRFQSSALQSPTEFKQAIGWRDGALFALAGVSFAASLICSAWSLTQTSVANSALLNNMMPIFTTLGAWLFLKQQFSLRFVMGLGVAIGGVMAIGLQDLHISSQQIMGDAAALLAAVLLAAAILSIEQLRTRFSTPVIMAGVCLTGSLAIAPIVLLRWDSVLPCSWKSGLAVLALALVCQMIGHGLLTHSLKQFSSGLVSVSMLAIPVLSATMAMVLFAQQLSFMNWCVFLIVLAGIYLSISAAQADPINTQVILEE